MIGRSLARLSRMDAAEIAWRGTTAATHAVRSRPRALVAPTWSRTDLLPALARPDELERSVPRSAGHRWDDAQRELARHFAEAPQRFVIGPAIEAGRWSNASVASFPTRVEHASRADRISASGGDTTCSGTAASVSIRRRAPSTGTSIR